MRVVDKYISKTVFNATLVALLIFIGLRLFIGIFGELRDMGNGGYGLLQVLEYVLLTMPLNIYELYPNVALLGALAALGILASSNELTVIRTSGLSIARISWIVIKVAIVLTILMTIVGEVFAPGLDAYAEREKNIQLHGSQAATSRTNLWIKEDNSFINIGDIKKDGEFMDVTRFTFNNDYQLVQTDFALNAKQQKGKWFFYHISTTKFLPNQIKTTETEKELWPLHFKPRMFNSLLDPSQMTLFNIRQQIHYNIENGLDFSNYSLAFWSRIFQPLATLVMVFLAIPFIFGPLRSSTMGLRILSGVMVGLAFYIVNRFFGPFCIVYQIPPIVAAVIPIILFFGLAVFLMRKKG